jgi:hypothetical protein
VKEKALIDISRALLSTILGALIALCLVGFFSVLYCWNAVDPGCNCYSQKIYMARVRWDKTLWLWQILLPITWIAGSAFLFYLSRIAGFRLILMAGIIAVLAFNLVSMQMPIERPESNFVFLSASKIMAYKYFWLGKHLIQPLFSWAFMAGLLSFSAALAGFIGFKHWRSRAEN